MTENRQFKIIRFLEFFWIIVGLASVLVGAYESINVGIENSYIFFIFAFVSGILYFLRRKQRIQMEDKSKNE